MGFYHTYTLILLENMAVLDDNFQKTVHKNNNSKRLDSNTVSKKEKYNTKRKKQVSATSKAGKAQSGKSPFWKWMEKNHKTNCNHMSLTLSSVVYCWNSILHIQNSFTLQMWIYFIVWYMANKLHFFHISINDVTETFFVVFVFVLCSFLYNSHTDWTEVIKRMTPVLLYGIGSQLSRLRHGMASN